MRGSGAVVSPWDAAWSLSMGSERLKPMQRTAAKGRQLAIAMGCRVGGQCSTCGMLGDRCNLFYHDPREYPHYEQQ